MAREVLNLTARHPKNGEANFGSYVFQMIVGDQNQIQVMVYIQELTEEVTHMVTIIGHPAIKLKMVVI